MAKALGILNFESDKNRVEGLSDFRTISAVSILGRYSVMDFMMSNFTNSGIDNICVFVKEKPRTLIEHINETDYNINTKKGNIRILHGERTITNPIYNTDVANFLDNIEFIRDNDLPYVIVAPSHFIFTEDLNEKLEEHIKSKNEISVLYKKTTNADRHYIGCDYLELDAKDRVVSLEENKGDKKTRLIDLETYIMDKEFFISLVEKAYSVSSIYWLRDIIREELKNVKVGGLKVTGYTACMNSLQSYFDASMELKTYKSAKQIFKPEWPIYTNTNDSCPTLYAEGGCAVDSIVGNGCYIEGKVEGSVIGRGVSIHKGAFVKNSIILPGAIINKNAHVENAVVDRFAVVTHIKALVGDEKNPLYVKRGDRV